MRCVRACISLLPPPLHAHVGDYVPCHVVVLVVPLLATPPTPPPAVPPPPAALLLLWLLPRAIGKSSIDASSRP